MATVQSVTGTLENTLFNGTYKSTEEIEFFMQNEGGHISIDNRYEIPMLEAVASKLGRTTTSYYAYQFRCWGRDTPNGLNHWI
jgi:diaminopimelate decarboxylase